VASLKPVALCDRRIVPVILRGGCRGPIAERKADGVQEWIVERGVPVFRPHVRRDPEGNVLYEVTADDIPVIAKNSARLTNELHGDKPPHTEGHRLFGPNAREADQPLVLGYQTNFRDGVLPDGTPAVVCDVYLLACHADRAKRHPYRSAEYDPRKKAIIGVARLTRPPALNLGAVFYPGSDSPVYLYAMGDDKVDDQTQAPPADQTQQTPALTPEEVEGCEKVYRYLTTKYAWMATCAQKYGATEAPQAGDAQGNNTAPPGEAKKKDGESEGDKGADDDKPEKKKDEPDMSQANTELVQKYEAKLSKTQDQLAALMREREGEKVDRLLDQLEQVERYQFNRPKERERMLAMTEKDRLERAAEIRENHHRLPGAAPIEVYQGNATGPVPETSRDVANRAVTYASKHGVSYDEGLAAVKAGKS